MTAPRGQRARLRGLALCLSLLAAGGTAAESELAPLPREAAGEIRFTLDAALFLDPDGAEEVYFVFAVPEEEIECVPGPEGEGDRHDLALELDNLGPEGEVLLERTQPLLVPCDRALRAERASGPAHRLLYLYAPWQSAGDRFEVRLLDRQAVRPGLLYQIEGSLRRGVARGRVVRPALEGGRGLSGIVFLWSAEEEAFAEGRRGDFLLGEAEAGRGAIDPNPRRAFGLRRTLVRAYVELYGLGDRKVEIRCRVRDSGGDLVGDRRATFRVPWDRAAVVHEFEAEPLESGSYDLEFTLTERGEGGGTWRIAAPFQVLWREGFWDQTEAELEAEARLLLTEEEMLRYERIGPGAREALLDSLWGDIDGLISGELLSGPTRALFAERMAQADARYAHAGRRGSFTDRGRVFIRYGGPDEVHKELMPAEQDLIGRFLEREIGDGERSDTGGALRRGLHDDSPYEVWYYMGRGEPLIPGREPPGRPQSLKFVFADRLGNGDYRLAYSNIFGGFH